MPLPSCAGCGGQLQPGEALSVRRGAWGNREFLHEHCSSAPIPQPSAEFTAAFQDVLASLRPAPGWDPALDVSTLRSDIVVSATDIAGAADAVCARHLAFKARPNTKLRSWRRSFQSGSPFPLGTILDLVLDAHDEPACSTYAGQRLWLDTQIRARGVHRLTAAYIRHAVEAVLEAHESLGSEVGPLRLLTRDPMVGGDGRHLTAWGPLYTGRANDGSLREIRRVRLGPAHATLDDGDKAWVAAAAMVAALSPAQSEATRIRVVEVGALDGSINVAFDGDFAQVREQYRQQVLPCLSWLLDGTAATAGWSCSSCKATGDCGALVRIDGAMHQASKGVATRSVSASALETYERCPARWLMQTSLHLPSEAGQSEAQERGRAVHSWLELAHRSGEPCVAGVVPESVGTASPGSTESFEGIAAYLAQHAGVCPLREADVRVVAVEENVIGWDSDADVVVTSKPDLVYRRGDQLVIRETKTSTGLPNDATEAMANHLQVSFALSQLAAGLGDALGGGDIRGSLVELEVLTTDHAKVFTWDASDLTVQAQATERLNNVVMAWHQDVEHPTRPGLQCVTCPVRRWCPDHDAWTLPATSPAPDAGAVPSPTDLGWDDEPPF